MASYDSRGNKTLTLADGALARTSGAYSPADGRGYRANKPRIMDGVWRRNTWKPRVYFTHDPAEVRLTYPNYLIFQANWEASWVGAGLYTKGTLGNSFQGRDMPYYRLGPVTRKHAVFTMCCHGNEHDGIKGGFKAMEILASYPEFQPFRDEWTIFFVPTLNPDGYALNTRNLANIGPNGYTVNLNRNWDWFWADYIESGIESKGAAPESEIEAQNLLNYWRFGDGGGAVNFGFVFDMHANKEPGARYQSRDRVWARMAETEPFGTTPGSVLEQDIHTQVHRLAATIATTRAREGTGPDLRTRTLHSRFNPVMHSYFSSQGVPSMIIEEIKIDWVVSGYETYATAADYRLDYCLAVGAALTSSYWESEDMVLLEPGGTNILTNPSLSAWSSTEFRPQYWSLARADMGRHPYVEGQEEDPDRFIDDGEHVEVTAAVAVSLPDASEYILGAMSGTNRAAMIAPATRKLYWLNPGGTSVNHGALVRNTLYGAACVRVPEVGTTGIIDILGGGTAAPATGAITTITRISNIHQSASPPSEANVGNLNTGRMFAAYCDNALEYPAVGSGMGWVFGGYNAAGARLTSIESWNPATVTATTKVAVLPAARANALAVYYPPTDKIYIFGGDTVASPNGDTAILVYDPTLDSISTHATTMSRALKYASGAYSGDDRKIWITGGERTTGAMNENIYSFDPLTGDWENHPEILTDLDNEDEEDGDTRPWNTLMGRGFSVNLEELAGDGGVIYTGGGRLTDTAGALISTIYTLDVTDEVMGTASDVNYGYFRFGTLLDDTRMTSFRLDDFAAGIDPTYWDNPSAAFVNGGGFVQGAPGLSGYLICKVAPTQPHHYVSCTLRLTGGGTHPDMGVVMRGTFTTAGAITAGYRVRYAYNGGVPPWYIDRVVGGVPTVIASLDVSGTPTSQVVSSGWRTLAVECVETSPVAISVTFNGALLFRHFDFHANRVVDPTGDVALMGGST